jgi:hypothetical protein
MSNVIQTKQCWRCDKVQEEEHFWTRYNEMRHDRLNICMSCIKEESSITGESQKELIGIYKYMQLNFKNLDKSMYKRFWLKAVS